MKYVKKWNYSPYTPLLFDSGDIYINRIVPGKTSIGIEWSSSNEEFYHIYYRVKDEGEFILGGTTVECNFTLTDLSQYCDYEFYVTAGRKKSRVRIARCGECVGTVVSYLHPNDRAYSFSGDFLCSPTIVRHPDGFLLASMDVYGDYSPQNLTLIYRSDDNGKTWTYVNDLFPCYWGKLFIHNKELYMIANSNEYGDILIGKSVDGGKTFTEPTVLFRGSNGKGDSAGAHKSPQPIVEFNGRLWVSMEWGSWAAGYFSSMVFSAPVGSDLLNPESWEFSEPLKYNPNWDGVATGNSVGTIEGSLVVVGNNLYNVMRYEMGATVPNYGKVISFKVDTENPSNPLQFDRCIDFPANQSKFEIKYDPNTKKYFTIASRIKDSENSNSRNILSVFVSDDAMNWDFACDIYNKENCNPKKIGLQYVDFLIENDEILFVCRTAMNNADTFHNSNYITFDKISISTILKEL